MRAGSGVSDLGLKVSQLDYPSAAPTNLIIPFSIFESIYLWYNYCHGINIAMVAVLSFVMVKLLLW